MSILEQLKRAMTEIGVTRAAIVRQTDILYNTVFRDICAQNSCGCYGACHMCPPDVGPIDELIAQAKQYPVAIMYQNVYDIEDSFDIEGMFEAKKLHHACAQQLHQLAKKMLPPGFLHLEAGGCGACARCSKVDGEPCRFPEKALSSLEGYGVDVYQTACNAGLKYVNGQNTITYFGMLLIKERDNV